MIDLGMHLADIVQNSIRAKAERIEITFLENSETGSLLFMVSDNGEGIRKNMIQRIFDPFFTTRNTRKVGLGIPFLKMTSEFTGGWCKVISTPGRGTITKALYMTNNPDCLPLGDIEGYLVLLLIANPQIYFRFIYCLDIHSFIFDSKDLEDEGIVDISNAEMADALKEYIHHNLETLFRNRPAKGFLTYY